MKKTYQIPTVDIVHVSPSNMIAASLGASDKPANGSVMLSKDGGYWDDDEPEEVGW